MLVHQYDNQKNKNNSAWEFKFFKKITAPWLIWKTISIMTFDFGKTFLQWALYISQSKYGYLGQTINKQNLYKITRNETETLSSDLFNSNVIHSVQIAFKNY